MCLLEANVQTPRKDYRLSPWLEGENRSQIECMLTACSSQSVHFSKDSIVYQQDEVTGFLYFVESGRVRLTITSIEGRTFHVLILKPGCLFGEQAYLDRLPHDTSAEAIVDTKILKMPYPSLDCFLEQEPQYNRIIAHSMASKLLACTQVIDNLVMKNSHSLVATYLKYIAIAHGDPVTADKVRFNIRFTHENIASITNLSRVTVSNIVGDLMKAGVIIKEGGQLFIRSMSDLDEFIS